MENSTQTEKPRTLSAWGTQSNVLFSLYQRELKNRFGLYRLGYVWAIAEPVALIVVLSAVRQLFGSRDISGVPYPLFFASGILPFLFFQNAVSQSLTSIESNLALLNYKIVKPADGIIARCFVELLIYTTSGSLIIGTLIYVWFPIEWNNNLGLMATFACLAMFTLGGCFLAAVVGPLYHESKKIVPIVLRPLFFLSGIFFAADSIPYGMRQYLLWNPLLHVSELTRQFMFKDYQSQEGSLGYLFVCSLIVLFLGLSVYQVNRIKLATSGAIR